jgi:hypothetical protein
MTVTICDSGVTRLPCIIKIDARDGPAAIVIDAWVVYDELIAP